MYRDGSVADEVLGTSFDAAGLAPGTTYTYNGVVWETIGGVDYARVAGALRFDTAAQAALDAFPAGADQYLTGAVVVRNAMTTWAIPMVDIGLASGENFPDALAGGAVMGYKHGLLLLTRPSMLSAPTASLITGNKATIESVEFFGGTSALAPTIPTTVRQLLQ